MITPRINSFYGLPNKILKLKGPKKSIQISEWNKSLNNLMRNKEPSMTPRGLLNFSPDCNNALFEKLFPDAAGPNPAANIRLVPTPIEIPPVPIVGVLLYYTSY